MRTVPTTPDVAPAPRAHRATTTSRLRFTPAPHSDRTDAASLPKGMPVVVTTDDLGVVTLHASIDGVEDYHRVAAAAVEFEDSDLDPEPAPAAPAAPAVVAAPADAELRSLLLDIDWSGSPAALDPLASSALELAALHPEHAAGITRAARAALLVRRAELQAAETTRTTGLLAWITRAPEAVAA